MKAAPPSRQKKPPHPQKFKFLCSFNGTFTTRHPNAGSGLRYVGGDTRLISVDRRHCLNLSNLFFILSHHHSSSSSSLYYQIPESSHLIPISTDEDVRKMVDAHDWLLSKGNVSRLRLFLIACDCVNEITHQRKLGNCVGFFDGEKNAVHVRVSTSPNGMTHQRKLGNCCESFVHVRFNKRVVCTNPNEMTHQRRGNCLKFGKIASCENKGIVQCRARSYRMGLRGSRVSPFGSNEFVPERVCNGLRPKSLRDKIEGRSVACDNHCFCGSVVSMSIHKPHGSLVDCYVSRDDFVSRTNLVENRSPLGKGDLMEDRSRGLGSTILDVAKEIDDVHLNDKVGTVGLTNICSKEVAENGSLITHNTALACRELQIINDSDLEEIRELGSGAYGTVFYGKWKGSDVAIKRLKSSCFSGGELGEDKLVADFWKEAHLLAQLHHPNVVAFYGVVKDGPLTNMATVTEFMVNGSLKQFLRKKDRTIDRRKRLIIAMDTAFGMEYLHEKNIVHFDLKSHNLLVNMKYPCRPICKIGDLGLSKVKQRTLVSGGVRGTIPWMAPELLTTKNNMVTEKVDVYSFGVVMWELLTGEEPYEDMRSEEIIAGIIEGCLRPDIPNWCDPSWRYLMQRCWSSDPSSRPSFSEISKELRSIAASLNIK